jgi:phosphate starvation-inducible PhoH-like protein
MICGVYSNFGLALPSYRGVYMKVKKSVIESNSKSLFKYQPRTENQVKYVEYLNNSNVSIVGGFGPAGSGKTLFACHAAVLSLKSGAVDKIIITRPLISVDDEQLGFLPGSIVHKMDPWTRPIFDILGEFYSVNQIRTMVESGVIEISPLAYMRGRTFKRSFIIADEMQNSSPNQMLMMLTRIGEESKLVITGDLKQSDRSGLNGLCDFIEKLRVSGDNSLIRVVELGLVDIQRSPVVSHIINIYDSNDSKKKVILEDAAIIPKGYEPKAYLL